MFKKFSYNEEYPYIFDGNGVISHTIRKLRLCYIPSYKPKYIRLMAKCLAGKCHLRYK